MVLIYFYLTHQIELGATMMNGNNADFQEDFWAFFLRTKSHSKHPPPPPQPFPSPQPLKLPDWAEFEI